MICVWCNTKITSGDDFYLYGYREGWGVSSMLHAGHCRYMMDVELEAIRGMWKDSQPKIGLL